MNKIHFYLLTALMLVVSCECKDMHVRRMPEEKNIDFKGAVKTPQKSVYRKGESRDIQIHLTSSDEEAKEAKFKILSATLADGSPADLDYTSLKLGNNTLHYIPQEPGTHALTIKVAVEGEEENAKTIHYTLEAPAAAWQVAGQADEQGNITLTINNAPEAWHNEPWHIRSTRWSRGLQGRIAHNLTQIQAGETTLPITLQEIALTELPQVHFNLQGPDRAFQNITLDLREVCVARLEETYSEERIQSIRNHNAAVREQTVTYQGNFTGNARAEVQRELTRLLDETARQQLETNVQLERLVANLNILHTGDAEDLGVLATRCHSLQQALDALTGSMNILQPMVTLLRASDQGPIDPWGVLYEALQQGRYEEASMAPHLNSPLLSDAINQEGNQAKTLLHLAIEQGHIALSRSMIAQGAEVNIRDLSGKTPIQYATEAENQEAIALLLGAGAIQGLPPDWQAQGSYEVADNQLLLTIGDAPGRLQQARGEQAQWRITHTTWSGGLGGQLAPNLVLQHGENRIPLAINIGTLTEAPTVQVVLQGPDRAFQSITLDLREVCVARLEETYSEERIQSIRNHNAAVREQTVTYQGNFTGNARAEVQRELTRLLDETARQQLETNVQLERLVANLNILHTGDAEDLGVLATRCHSLQQALDALTGSMNILQPMVTLLRASDQGPIDPWGVLYEALQQGRYEEASMAPHLNSPLLSDAINQEGNQAKTLLHLAIEQGHIALSRSMIAQGAEVNIRDLSGKTPIQYATEAENQEAIALLLGAGAIQGLPPDWQAQGSYEVADNQLLLTIGDAPGRLQQARGEQAQWRITHTTWSGGLGGQLAPNLVLQHGENRIPLAINIGTLTEAPTVQVVLQGPERAFQSITLDLREVCVARLEETYSEERIQSIRNHNAAVREQTVTYQGNFTGNARAEVQRELTRFLDETARQQLETNVQLERLVANLNILHTGDAEDLGVLATRRHSLQQALDALTGSMNILQPMVTLLRASDQGPIDPWGVLYEALQQGRYEEASMAPHLNSPLLSDAINQEGNQAKTLLHLAIEQGHIALSRSMIAQGAEVNIRDLSGKTPIQYATEAENQEAIALLLNAGAVQDLKPDWQLQGNYENAGQQLILNIADTPGRSQQARNSQAQWRVTRMTWSEGLDGQIAPNLVLQHGENRIPLAINMATLTEAPSVQIVLQGSERAYQNITLDLREVCVAKLQPQETELEGQTERVNRYVQETDTSYQLPAATVTDPRVNREKQNEVGTLLGRLEAFQTQYERDMQAFSGNLTVLGQTQVNENLAVFEANNKRLKDAIASLKSAQVQLQQQCTSAHTALFKTLENENQEASMILLEDPRLDVNARNEDGIPLLHKAVLRNENIEVVRKLIERRADVNVQDQNGEKALLFAIRNHSNDILRLLLTEGADPNGA